MDEKAMTKLRGKLDAIGWLADILDEKQVAAWLRELADGVEAGELSEEEGE